ncbi:MAG: acetyl-CoA carboxylase biotin carboxylase subunit [Bacteroidales bacterium]|nr:MAG: acetyl-CoA carboxylase biotin carboxylase subunit [Bacteroidales bacterium]
MKLFRKILIANRGEIAVRINRAAKEMGIPTVAIFAEADRNSMHAEVADEAYCIGKESLSDTYLNIKKIIQMALKKGCDAIHPGYGFLAENPDFVNRCESAGLVFVGPSAKVIELMGNKIKAREFIRGIDIPIVGGAVAETTKSLLKAAQEISYPVLLKAAGGGGGKGMRVVCKEKDLLKSFESTSREALNYFGDGTIYIEKYLEDPRHIEFQILGDNNGRVVHVLERECSIQRRYQKIIEESPSPTLTPEVRKEMANAAVRIGKKTGYNNAGTIEFLVDKNLNYYFLEMNTRIQVEHPVTEMTTGLDLVKEQIMISAGNPLQFTQDEIKQKGHAIEARIYAEDPANDFLPSPGLMTYYSEPEGRNIRVDSSTVRASEINSLYDPMISKLIAFGKDRDQAAKNLANALGKYIIHGIKTNIPYLIGLVRSDDFLSNRISTTYCDYKTTDIVDRIKSEKLSKDLAIPLFSYLSSIFIRKNTDTFPDRSDDFNIWNYIGYWRNNMRIPVQIEGINTMATIRRVKYPCFIFDFEDKRYRMEIKDFKKGVMSFTLNNRKHITCLSHADSNLAYVTSNGLQYELKRNDILTGDITIGSSNGETDLDTNTLTSPIPGKVIKVNSGKGEKISRGDIVVVIEAMKMENNIVAHRDAVIDKVYVSVGQMIEAGVPLVSFE